MIIVTGGAGFIGSCFLKKLNDNGIHDIIVVDRLGTSLKWKNLLGKRFLRFIDKVDFRKNYLTKDFGSNVEAVFHFGACSTTTERDADYIMDNNLNYSIDLAEFCQNNYIRFIYASSAATYGLGENGYSDTNFESLSPLNVYGFSKSLFDQWVIDNFLDKTFTGLKFFNVFGPNEYHKGDMASMIYKSYLQIKESGKVKLFESNRSEYADGEQMRDFVYVKDSIDIIWKIFENNDFAGIYNLGTGKARTWNSLVTAVFNSMNERKNIEYIDMPESLTKQYQYYTEADMSKLESTKCSHSFMSLEDSIDDYVKNYLIPQKYY
jgi:ADP-L-glycero-D-manno-heptose 6-epimerase